MIVELRRYTLREGRRDELIDLFDREFVETQEELGMAVLGQFRDLDRPDQFVWLRGFTDMQARRTSLTAFYSGPVWAKHGPAANATMLDSDDVLLLREIVAVPVSDRSTANPESVLHATIWYWAGPFPDPTHSSTQTLALLRTEYAPNDYPRLPIREQEHALVWLTRSPLQEGVPTEVVKTERFRLSPTRRSSLHWRTQQRAVDAERHARWCVGSGRGDGVYATHVGRTADGRLASFVTDFRVVLLE
ncbi:NIPSNAP family protein [Micromonospora qiuiae]|uniref:NIPSNAP family protein n=1 Tax=Micromonospora qiuiae TaxID=502268 RepID=A0ABQ4JF89_9ACTN|nr:NIPSNAP family protein [Micromonospora qiuiae]GIJ28954.1 NIPSNAP family protein [Micromonospora qiuiae]